LERTFNDQNDIGIAYIYCNYKEEGQTAVDLVGSIMQQLVQRHSHVSSEIRALYKTHYSKRTRPTFSECSTLLQMECRPFSKVFIVIDALDECLEADGTRHKLLSALQKLPPTVCLLVTSRPHIREVTDILENAAVLEVIASDHDIRAFLAGQMEEEGRLKRLVKTDPTLRETIINTIVEKVKGMSVPKVASFANHPGF
jgi:hypothetical protein